MIPPPPVKFLLISQIIENAKQLKTDFTGFSIHLSGVINTMVNMVFTIALIILFYLVGKRIFQILKLSPHKFSSSFRQFTYIALGYISIGTLVAIFGVFSILYKFVIIFFLICITFFAVFPLSNITQFINTVIFLYKNLKQEFKVKKWIIIGIILFVCISFFRLILPETVEDAVGYHTDLPSLYIKNHSMMLESREPQHVLFYSQLGEMTYILPIIFDFKEATRYIHFAFYLLCILLILFLAKEKKYNFARFAPIFLITSPIVIKIASSANTDFFMLFCFILAVITLVKEKVPTRKTIFLSAILFGGAVATKGWIIIYVATILIYLFLKLRKSLVTAIEISTVFILTSLVAPFIWYIRSYISTGDPIFPALSRVDQFVTHRAFTLPIGFNYKMFYPDNLIVLSPLFFIGIIFLFVGIFKNIRVLKGNLFTIIFILCIEQLLIKFYLGRHLLAWYSISIFASSLGISSILHKSAVARVLIFGVYIAMLIYYFTNTLLVLPYGFGWADKNAYLTRILSRDNSSYYDFNRMFDKWFTKEDKIATYGIYGFYYLHFDYVDINYLFRKKNESFDILKLNGITKIFIKGKNMQEMCKDFSIRDCTKDKYKLLAQYDGAPRYLYQLTK